MAGRELRRQFQRQRHRIAQRAGQKRLEPRDQHIGVQRLAFEGLLPGEGQQAGIELGAAPHSIPRRAEQALGPLIRPATQVPFQ